MPSRSGGSRHIINSFTMSKNVSGFIVAQLNEEFFYRQREKMESNDLSFFKSFEDFLKQYRKLRTWVSLVVGASGSCFRIKEGISKLIPTKEEGGLFDYRDEEIIHLFGDRFFQDKDVVTGNGYIFSQEMGTEKIIKEAEHLCIYREYSIGEALMLGNELAKKNLIVEPVIGDSMGVIIFLKETEDDFFLALKISKDRKEKLSAKLVRVAEKVWPAGYGTILYPLSK